MSILALFAALAVGSFPQPGPVALRAALHVHTTFSDGSHTVEEIARRALEEGIDIVILSDHFRAHVEYGPPLLRKALAVSVESPSLDVERLEGYIWAARRAEQETGVLILPGVEITPFYYWDGSLLTGDLTLHSAHRHLLVLFPDDEADRVELGRTLSEMSAPGPLEFHAGSLVLAWPLLPALWAIHRLRRQPGARASTVVLGLVLIGSVVSLVRAWPFREPRYSPYDGDAGAAPYQAALDTSHSASVLTFWAHPETSSASRHPHYPVDDRSDVYPELIAATRGGTGFASLYEGDRRAAAPNGPWDQALGEFAYGERAAPVWTVGELDLHREGEAGGKFLGEVETIVLANEPSHRGVLDALGRGAMYAVRQTRESRLRLDGFRVACQGDEVTMGEWTERSGPCRIDARLSVEGQAVERATVSLVRNGELIASEDVDIDENGVAIEWDDAQGEEPTFYRLVAKKGNRMALFANPAFAGIKEASR